MASKPDIWLAAGLRTPFAKVDGPLKTHDAIALSVPVVQAMLAQLSQEARAPTSRSGGR
jgi:acetyl-CoA C-acetyltransferase